MQKNGEKKMINHTSYRNSSNMDNNEYRRMRKAEDSSYEYHGADTEETDKENADDGYPEAVEHNKSGRVYDLKTDFIVLLPARSSASHRTATLRG